MGKIAIYTVLVGALCLCVISCTPAKKVEPALVPAVVSETMETDPAPHDHDTPPPIFSALTLDVYAYPKAIATQEDIVLEAEDTLIKRNAYLSLVSLHMNRINPNQDFLAASLALTHAVELDPSLVDRIAIQRWLDVFALLHEMQDGYTAAGRLQDDNDSLKATLKKQQRTITYLEATLEELRKVEQDVAEKKRLYR